MAVRPQLSLTPVDRDCQRGGAWARWLTEAERRLDPDVPRRDVRRRARASLRGWLRPVERTPGGQRADVRGDVPPLACSICGGAPSGRPRRPQSGAPQAVVGMEETEGRKPGTQSAGVTRQKRGPAGRSAHGPMGVGLASARARGQAVRERAWSVPTVGSTAPQRCARRAPGDRAVAPQPQRARPRLERPWAVGGPAAWGTGASGSSDAWRVRVGLERQEPAHGRAVSGTASAWIGGQQRRAGAGATSSRLYDGSGRPLATPMPTG
jgi:hypothetical protein